ncbi:MAG TPA: carbamoyltransferase HypF, partial [Acidimicrobiales bacterium]|nr:carbamoyltransferase HypF [Acidimicrobiales bacterium]
LEVAGSPEGFHILESASHGSPSAPVAIDTAACGECLAEVDDPRDRRHGYPFTNCTNCGPRYTIVVSVPYDRPATTMAGFAMCDLCQAEYDDPGDRRFHAQPNSCPRCGPRLSYREPDGTVVAESERALGLAVQRLLEGGVVAVKGLGGYHLAVDATNDAAVRTLRRRKARDDKPFAVMVADLATARSLCELDALAAATLASPRRPIVLAPRTAAPLSPGVAPGLRELGLILPYTPLHHLLMAAVGRPLVMTSGNLSDDPIAHLDDDAIGRLGPLVDGLLSHDRPIHVRCDDSVVRSAGGRVQAVRRSRGFAPEALTLTVEARRQVLAVGAELKNTVSVAKGTSLVTSHHIGDLEHLATYEAFLQATTHLPALYGVEADVVVHDLHPEYLSTKYALDLDLETCGVQHHHAHVASCLAEHGRTEAVLGVAFDGLGLGLDGVLWGGEFLVADLEGFERLGHLADVAMPGGTAAVREPWRMALSWVAATLGPGAAARLGPGLDERWRLVLQLVERDHDLPRTTSVGRLFDAVAALLGIRTKVTYEGQAAIELEALAAGVPDTEATAYPVEVREDESMALLDPAPLIGAVVEELQRGTPPAVVAAGFHKGLGLGAAVLAARLAAARRLDTVALSGGVFQNVRLSAVIADELRRRGLGVLVHELVPPNDGGISVGQAAIGATASHLGRPPTSPRSA